MARIVLRNRVRVISYSLIDDEDAKKARKHRWWINSTGYPSATINGKNITLHRFLLNPPKGMDTDHINRNKLDNRKSNLRICTHQQNSFNFKRPAKTSKYKGVNWDKERKKWFACIQKSGKTIALGRFLKEKDAAKAHDKAATKFHGEFACLNFALL